MERLESINAFGAILMEGVLAHEVALGDRVGLRLLGPGDIVVGQGGLGPLTLTGSVWFPCDRVRVAVLDSQLVAALSRWPNLTVGLYTQVGQQLERLTTQLLISQLPRVEDRLLGLMWLMAESWGRVTPMGTRVPLEFTHEALGRMIGARRPTVSLALRELTEQGALVRQSDGWMLLKPLYAPDGSDVLGNRLADGDHDGGPFLVRDHSPAAPELPPEHRSADAMALLQDAVARLREQHQRDVERFAERLERLRETRERCRDTRIRVRRHRSQA
jgi:CRP-like cAMP-binding protein